MIDWSLQLEGLKIRGTWNGIGGVYNGKEVNNILFEPMDHCQGILPCKFILHAQYKKTKGNQVILNIFITTWTSLWYDMM